MAKTPDLKNSKLARAGGANNDGHNHGQQPAAAAAHVQIKVPPPPPPNAHRSPNQSTLAAHASKPSKSKRFTDPHETAPLDCKDYIWLAVFYLGFYLFLLLFWFACWYVYTMSLPERGYRYSKEDLTGAAGDTSALDGESR